MQLLKALPIVLIVFISGCAAYQPAETGITPEYSIGSLEYPASVKAGEEFAVSWKVNANLPTAIKHTAIHYSAESHPGDYGLDVAPGASGYPSLTSDYASVDVSIPDTFAVKITAPEADKLYFRAHAVIDGKNYWTQEYSMDIESSQPGTLQGEVAPPSQQQPPPLPTTQEFTFETDDSGYYKDGQKVTSISATKNNIVKITFNLRTQGIYFAGAEYRGCGTQSPSAPPGGTTSMQFTASFTCTITAYWPASGVAKESLQVTIS